MSRKKLLKAVSFNGINVQVSSGESVPFEEIAMKFENEKLIVMNGTGQAFYYKPDSGQWSIGTEIAGAIKVSPRLWELERWLHIMTIKAS